MPVDEATCLVIFFYFLQSDWQGFFFEELKYVLKENNLQVQSMIV
jgi:hypothetical protein